MARTIRGIVVLMVLVLVVAACGGVGSEEPATTGDTAAAGGEQGGATESTTLSFLVPSYSDNTQAIWDEIIAGFEEANPGITVELEIQSWDNINDVIRTKVQAGEAPDILNIDAFVGFAQDDLLYPAAEIVSSETFDDFQTSFVENATYEDTVYGLPLIASTRTLFYNTALFEEAGISEPPATWDELMTAAEAISALGDDIHGYGMPLGSEEAQAETSIWTFGAGGSWTDDSGNITVNTPENLAAVEQMQEMIDAGVTQPDPGATDRSPLMNVFIQGNIGMIEGLPPTVDQIAERNPDLEYDTAPIPTEDGSPATLGVADHLMAFDKGEDKTEAIRTFLDYFFTTENYLEFVDGEGFLPTTKSGAEATENAEKFATFLEGLPDARFYPSTNPGWSATQGGLQSLIGQIGQGSDPAEVLDQIQAQVEEG